MTLRRSWVVAGLCAVLLAPLLAVDVPPLLDYPNHLARVYVLASLPHDPVLARFYAARWSIIPNLAVDLLGPMLINLLPVYVAGRVLIAVAVLLPVLGTVAYNAALGGRWWSLGVGIIAYNSALLAGFLNFEIAVGLAFLLAAGWLRWRETRPVRAILAAILGAPILFFCHLMGVVLFGVLIGAAEASHGWSGAVRRAGVLVLIFVPPVLLYAGSDLRGLGGDSSFLPLGEKLLQAVTVFTNYSRTLDVMTAALAIGVPVAGLMLRLGQMPRPAAIAAMVLLVAYLGAPFAWKGTQSLDTRFAVMSGFMLFAGFIPNRRPAWIMRSVAVAVVLLFSARMALLTTAWAAHGRDLADVRAVLAPVQAGEAVYVAEAGLDEARAYWAANQRWRLLSSGARADEHIGALALIEHRAWWPFEFDNPSQQPIETLEPYRGLAERVGKLPNRAQAAIADLCGFDYVLLTGADAVPPLPASRFRLLRQAGFAALYTVERCQEDK